MKVSTRAQRVSVQRNAEQEQAQEQEWVRQNYLIYGGLMGIGAVMVQPFLTAAPSDQSAVLCVVAYAIAMPLLAGLVMINRQEVFRRRAARSRATEIARVVALVSAFVGVVSGFWHMVWIAGVVMLVCAVLAVVVHSLGYARLERVVEPEDTQHQPPPTASRSF